MFNNSHPSGKPIKVYYKNQVKSSVLISINQIQSFQGEQTTTKISNEKTQDLSLKTQKDSKFSLLFLAETQQTDSQTTKRTGSENIADLYQFSSVLTLAKPRE